MLRQPLSIDEAEALKVHLRMDALMNVKEFDFAEIELKAGILPEDCGADDPMIRKIRERDDYYEAQRRESHLARTEPVPQAPAWHTYGQP